LRTHRLSRILADQRGIAMPMALMIILILSALMAAFSVLGASEPTLAANQQRVAQARAIAESGLERAIWALNNPSDASGIPNPLVTPAAPYDGSTAAPVMLNGAQVGVFRVSVTNGAAPSERNIVATGWVPSDTAASRVKQRIQVTVTKGRFLDAPGPLSVRGELDIGGNSLIDASQDTADKPSMSPSCGNKGGTWSKGATSRKGTAAVCNYEGGCGDKKDTPKKVVYDPSDSATWQEDIVTDVPDSVFDSFTYSNDELDMLKVIARASGHYYQGSVLFNAGNPVPNGLIFVDTGSGKNIIPATPSSDFGALKISGNAAADADNVFKGWIIVNGSASIDGIFQMHGLLYVVNDLTYQGIGSGQIVGAVISQNIRDYSSTTIDSDTGGNSTIIWNCAYAKNGDLRVPQSYFVKPGTYKEVAG